MVFFSVVVCFQIKCGVQCILIPLTLWIWLHFNIENFFFFQCSSQKMTESIHDKLNLPRKKVDKKAKKCHQTKKCICFTHDRNSSVYCQKLDQQLFILVVQSIESFSNGNCSSGHMHNLIWRTLAKNDRFNYFKFLYNFKSHNKIRIVWYWLCSGPNSTRNLEGRILPEHNQTLRNLPEFRKGQENPIQVRAAKFQCQKCPNPPKITKIFNGVKIWSKPIIVNFLSKLEF